jgi:tetratricopeptide (TPR) repeat protein
MMSSLPPLWRARPQQLALGLAAFALGLCGFVPLFGGPGYEAALSAGLVLPSAVAIATALEVAKTRVGPGEALGRGLVSGTVGAIAGLVLAWIHGLRVGFCDPVEGTALYLLGGGSGALMGGAWGAGAGLVARFTHRKTKTLAVLLALLGPVGGVVLSLWRFYTSAMVFAFDPFFGVFSGPLYDTIVDRTRELLTYRVGSALTLTAASVLAHGLVGTDQGLGWRRLPRGITLAGGLALAGSLAITLAGSSLGHYTTPASLRRDLGREMSVGSCEVVYAKTILDRDARALGRECAAHLAQLGQFFGTQAPERVTAFLFANAADKARLMGAGRTVIAKPWRREIYLQSMGYPHPAIRHELAHVVAGVFARGPLSVAGPLRGMLPDPGRIEGFAVAAAPDEDDDLTVEQWAKTLLELGLLPPLEQVFRLSFMAENSSKAYTVAGAFVAWLGARYGREVLVKWYGGADLESVTGGKSLEALEGEWKSDLKAVAVPRTALETARLRFDRPAIFGRRCPRVVDKLEQTAALSLAGGDYRTAQAALERVLTLDPGNVAARLGVGTCALRAGDQARARRELAEVAEDPKLRALDRARARELNADLDFYLGRIQPAVDTYRELEQLLVSPDRLRELELKRNLATDPVARRAVAALLVGDPRLGPNWGVAAAELGGWASLGAEEGTAAYLLGRNLFQQGRWREGAEYLDRALARRIPLARVHREALRMRLVAACAEEDRSRAESAYTALVRQPETSRAAADAVRALGARCLGRAPGESD